MLLVSHFSRENGERRIFIFPGEELFDQPLADPFLAEQEL
jgi:hypothetical protein